MPEQVRPTPKQPWSPTGIAVLTLIFSPVAGGILHGLNYGRLGRRPLQRFAVSRNLFAGVLLILWAWFLPGLARSGASLFFAAYFYKTQGEAFHRHLSEGGGKGSLSVAVLVCLLVLLLVLLLAPGLPG